jgi:N-acetylmuramoyl-L-alanine amidase
MERRVKLAINAGHGMSNVRPGVLDTGAVSGGMRECDVTLAWALTMKQGCIDAGIPYYLTRGDNVSGVFLGRIDDVSEDAGCTHLLSIHMNDGPPSATGCEAYYRDDADKSWAVAVCGAAVSATGLVNRGAKSEGESQHSRLAVFDFDGPCALIEGGFITNLTDRSLIATRDVRLLFARRVCEALKRWRDTGSYQ